MIAALAPLGAVVVRRDPPLDPSSEEAKEQLRRELADPSYRDRNVLQQLLDWIDRSLNGGVEGARELPSLTWFAVTLIVVLLVAALAFLASRARGTARARRGRDGDVLTAETVTAAELRSRAERAMAEGRYGEAVVEGFRALARRQVERGRLEDSPGVTAHEVAATLAAEYPGQGERTAQGADLFDAVMYGERPATREQAAAVLDLDLELATAR